MSGLLGRTKPGAVFCMEISASKTTTKGLVLVKVHPMSMPAAVAAASSVTVLAAKFGVNEPPAPKGVQLIPVRVYPAGGTVSVMTVAVPMAVRICVTPATAVPARVVVMLLTPKPLVPVKPKLPTPLIEILDTVSVGNLVLVNVQSTFSLGITNVALLALPLTMRLVVVEPTQR